MSAGPARHHDSLLHECLDELGLLDARIAALLGGGKAVPNGLLRALRDAAAEPPCMVPMLPRSATDGSALLRVLTSDACPACGSAEVGTVESVAGLALCRISDGRLEWSGQTEIDWNGSETLMTGDGPVLACASCGQRWVHPSLVLEGP